jgi:nicotinamide-nucleotide amidase
VTDPTPTETADELSAMVQLASRIQSAMIEHGLTLATAESCTGGLVGHLLTETAGSSAYYVGGLISYSNELKEKELGVDAKTLERHGAVSAQTCVAMAEGARSRYGASLGLAITGIAGPDGGSEQKPVGLTYVGVADDGGHDVRRNVWQGDRHSNKMESAEAALRLVLERLGVSAESG